MKSIHLISVVSLFLFQYSFAVSFTEDTIDLSSQLWPKIHVENDSSYNIKIDSIRLELISGTIDSEVYFIIRDIENNTQMFLFSYISSENDTLYNLQQYNDPDSNKIEMLGNSTSVIEEFRIGTDVRSELPTVENNNEENNVDLEYLVKLIFNSSDGLSGYVVLKGHNVRPSSTVIKGKVNNYKISSSNIPQNSFLISLSGKKLSPNRIFNLPSSIYLIKTNQYFAYPILKVKH